ncbi:MAG: TaqI-like C-terminal specificity domain-containing protein [Desulfococcaceae bacterium]
MNLNILKPRKALNKAFLKIKAVRDEFENFRTHLIGLLDRIDENESEEFHKNLVSDFLRKNFYEPNHFINTKGHTDLVIHSGKDAQSPVAVIMETKKPGNKAEMLRHENINVKAFQELVLYYLRERISGKNIEIRHVIATDIYEWFIFDANFFEKEFAQNRNLVSLFNEFEAGRLSGKTTDFFYKEIAAPAIASIETEISFAYFDIREYENALRNPNPENDIKLIDLFKIFSPEHLLKLPFSNDSNSLDRNFYAELLHIIGVDETKDGNRKVIQRKKKESERNTGFLIENTILRLDSLKRIQPREKDDPSAETYEDRLFTAALELVITWINRVLFLKLLEAQLISYHKGDKSYAFLHIGKIKNFDALNCLFFQVLACRKEQRDAEVVPAFDSIPWLNSSLFEPTELEDATIFVSNLKDANRLPIFSSTVLKDEKGKKRTGDLRALEYLFAFLDAYDFSSEGSGEIQDEKKSLISASVLGLIFEKINGYRDGSYFTPGFVTMYMCRETVRRAVVQKFNEKKGWNCNNFDDLYDRIEDRKEANAVVNSLKICDPAVGSGHFPVSALNEIIAVKNDLKILQDRDGKRLKEYHAEVVNDEIIITDEDGKFFQYSPRSRESQRVQEALFHEKQSIIENCLFGVDINPNSVKICRLRLWIELLKSAYYKEDGELETLPNIDINIRCGNSLISRFALDTDVKKVLKKSRWTVDAYRIAVQTYRQSRSSEEKRDLEKLMYDIKKDFRSELGANNPKEKSLARLSGELHDLLNQNHLFEQTAKEKKAREQKQKKLEAEISRLSAEVKEMQSGRIYRNAFEWRFEFPEVLNDDGEFTGFDIVIGNPPYISLSKIKGYSGIWEQLDYQTYSKGADIYCLFYERGNQILKKNGLLTYITSNSWMRAIYGELLKSYFKEQMQPLSILNIEDTQIFGEATVESCIVYLQKNPLSSSFAVCNLGHEYKAGSSLSDYFSLHQFDFSIPETSEWVISSPKSAQLKLKMERDTKLLKDFDININFGIKTGYNEAFIIDSDKKDELMEADSKNTEIIKPILRGRDLKKYSYEFAGYWAICIFPSLNLNIDDYSAVKDYFMQIGKDRLEQSGNSGSRKKTGNEWFETQDPVSYWKDFEKPKIIWGEISDTPKFAYDEDSYYAEATTFIMTGKKLKYLLAVLNSKVSKWYFSQISTTTGMGTNRWKKYKIELLPIKIPSKKQEKQIENLVSQILAAKKNPHADTTALEKEIDRLVYDLYGLTEEEIDIVERRTEKQ